MPSSLTLRDALNVINSAPPEDSGAPLIAVGLACSFTPLHLQNLLHANMQLRRPASRFRVEVGLYGDLAGSVQSFAEGSVDAAAVVIDWSDLDPRLGMREAAAAPPADAADIEETARARLARLAPRLAALAQRCPVALVAPTLPLPPAYAARRGRLGGVEARLRLHLASLVSEFAAVPSIRIVDPDCVSEVGRDVRRDLRADIRAGFPFSVPHASALSSGLADALLPEPAKKGLITDLDDTMWRGLVGEVGAEGVSWDPGTGNHVHALYQQMLSVLGDQGVLLGVASKNELGIVREALGRADLLVDLDRLYPISASWGRKSEAVGEILRTWNVGAADVVFVDDNPLELAEVEAAFPGITTKRFCPEDPGAVAALLEDLRGAFWRETTTAEDGLRVASIRAAADVDAARSRASDERVFLADLRARIVIDTEGWTAPRALELVNKTNQFNLNGRRLDESEWRRMATRPGGIACTVAYEDRFGPLGVVSVLSGVVEGPRLDIDCWVLSCRAFSRAIEHHVLAALVDRFDVKEVVLDYVPTERNGVLAGFLTSLGVSGADGECRVEASKVIGGMSAIHEINVER